MKSVFLRISVTELARLPLRDLIQKNTYGICHLLRCLYGAEMSDTRKFNKRHASVHIFDEPMRVFRWSGLIGQPLDNQIGHIPGRSPSVFTGNFMLASDRMASGFS